MKKLVVTGALAFMVLNFIACDSGYVEETRKPNDYIAKWDRAEQGIKAGEITPYTPKSYKSEKANTQPPFVILVNENGKSVLCFEAKRSDEVQSVKVNGGKCEVGETRRDSTRGLSALLKCDAKSVSKIEIETNAGNFTYKF